MDKLTKPQRYVLERLRDAGRSNLAICEVSIATWKALAVRGLIRVDTTFDSIALPRTGAWAVITKAGRAALQEAGQ